MKEIWCVAMFNVLLLFTGLSGATAAELSPLESLRSPLNQIILLLNDSAYIETDQKAAQREKIWEIARPIFDFAKISRRAVGKSWDRFTLSEQVRFIDVFARFLGTTYVGRLQGEYDNEAIDYQKELIKANRALVRTIIRHQNTEIPVDYRLNKIDGAWKVYDILIEGGVSLVKNYRVQFSSILQKESPAQLIERLENKLAEQAGSL